MLWASVFGISRPIHLKGDFSKNTQSIDSEVWEEKPVEYSLSPRIRTYHEKNIRSGIIDRSAEKERLKQLTVQRLEQEKKLRNSFIHI